jgi:hypothetical protein
VCAIWAHELDITLDDARNLIEKTIESPWQLLTRPREPEPRPLRLERQREAGFDREMGG